MINTQEAQKSYHCEKKHQERPGQENKNIYMYLVNFQFTSNKTNQ